MKLIAVNKEIPYGQAPETLGWITWTTFKNAPGWGLFVHIPLFLLRWQNEYVRPTARFGWYIPVVGFRHDKSDCWALKIGFFLQFHSDFMGEPKYKELW